MQCSLASPPMLLICLFFSMFVPSRLQALDDCKACSSLQDCLLSPICPKCLMYSGQYLEPFICCDFSFLNCWLKACDCCMASPQAPPYCRCLILMSGRCQVLEPCSARLSLFVSAEPLRRRLVQALTQLHAADFAITSRLVLCSENKQGFFWTIVTTIVA